MRCSQTASGESYADRDFLPGDNVNSAQFPGLILPVALILDPPDVDYLVREELRLQQQLEEMPKVNVLRPQLNVLIQNVNVLNN